MKNIININSKGQHHGYQEIYFDGSDLLWYRCTAKNNYFINYTEEHSWEQTIFYIK